MTPLQPSADNPVAWRVRIAGEWQVFTDRERAANERQEYEWHGPHGEPHEEPLPLYAHPSRGVVDEVIAALDQISGLTRALRNGGPAPEDLQELSDALTEATNVAWCASRALQAAQPAVPSVPEGMVLVPKVPTPEMDAAGRRALSENGVDCVEDSDALVCYAAMLAATPKDQPAQGVDGG